MQLEHDIVRLAGRKPKLFGRTKIFTNFAKITAQNVVEMVGKAVTVHNKNKAEEHYLHDYAKGDQPVLYRRKAVRPEIQNDVVVNRAGEILAFKTSYLLSAPIQYISTGDGGKSDEVAMLNRYMAVEDKDAADKSTVDWMHTCGVGVRLVLPNEDYDVKNPDPDSSPAHLYSLDPRNAFVVYNSGLGEKPVCGVLILRDEDGQTFYTVYTADEVFEVKGDKIITQKVNSVGMVPMVEYTSDMRLGAFEDVITLLDALSVLASNRLDGVEEFVQGYDVFQNIEISEEQYKKLNNGGQAIMVSSQQGAEAKVYRIASELSQTGAQTLSDDLYDSILTICGMPNRNGGSSTSDTGTAVIYRDGWGAAEARAKATEKRFCRAEKQMLRIFLRIVENATGMKLGVSDLRIEFTRSNLSNLQSRVQVLCEMLNNSRVHPKIAWETSGLPNADECYQLSEQFYAEEQAKLLTQLKDVPDEDGDDDGGEEAT